MNRRIRVALAAVLAVPALGSAGCGAADRTSAADDVPALRASLSRVDDAMASRRYPAAQKALRQLITDVRRARAAGDLDAATASDIVAAARALLTVLDAAAPATDLPTPAVSESPEHDPTPRPTRTPSGKPSREPTAVPTPAPSSVPSSVPSPQPTGAPASDSTSPVSPGAPASSSGVDLTTQTPSTEPTTHAATASP